MSRNRRFISFCVGFFVFAVVLIRKKFCGTHKGLVTDDKAVNKADNASDKRKFEELALPFYALVCHRFNDNVAALISDGEHIFFRRAHHYTLNDRLTSDFCILFFRHLSPLFG